MFARRNFPSLSRHKSSIFTGDKIVNDIRKIFIVATAITVTGCDFIFPEDIKLLQIALFI
jgi:hypothetical protein